MTENHPPQRSQGNNPPHYGARPSYGSTPDEGTRLLPLTEHYGQAPQQRYGGGMGPGPGGGMGSGTSPGTGGGAGAGTHGPFGTGPTPPQWSGQPGQPPVGPSGPAPKRRGFALVAVTALVVGAAGGVGGAAAYTALGEPGTDSSVTAPLNTGGQAAPVAAPDGSVQKAAQAVLPSVVKIGLLTSRGAGSGSGIVVRADGLIVTNNHVVAAAADGGGRITVTLHDGKTVPAQIVGRDELTDLAVIKADAKGLTPAKLGASRSLAVGQPVVAIGSPFGLEATVTSGIVSALNRPVSSGDGQDNTTVFPAVQTDAAINPGNSGGALIDLAGRVVGINSAIKTAGGNGQSPGGNIGLGFAIPIDQAKPIVDELAAKGTATHARLGVTVGPVESSDGLQSGAQVGEVTPGGAADKAGLKAGDVITAVDGRVIASGDALVAGVRSHRPGDEVTVTYRRGSETRSTTAKLDSDDGRPTG